MKISVYASSSHVKPAAIKGRVAVVVDMLRASSTIIAALNNGASAVAPMPNIEQCIAIRAANRDILLGGERNAEKIQGFDFGNSPLEFTKSKVAGKNIVLCTSNGSKAIKSADYTKKVIIGALINVSAVVKKLLKLNSDVAIICAGTNGNFSIDDIVTAGAIISKLKENGADLDLDDLGILCAQIYDNNRNDLHTLMKDSQHYALLNELGFTDDLKYCLTEDQIDFAPECFDGSITK